MSEALYSREILRLAVSIPNQHRLDNPDGSAELRSKTCGSRVVADIMVGDNGIIQELGVEVNACALGQASTAILGATAPGKSVSDIASAREHLAAFLDGQSDSPGLWDNMDVLIPAREHVGRHEAILLPYDAVIAAFASTSNRNEAA